MNKQKIATSFILILSFFLVVSCTNEPVDPTLSAQLAAANASSSNGGNGSGGGGILSGDYFPAALNNQWTYTQNGASQSPTKMISIDNINGFTYYTFSQSTGTSSNATGTATQRLRKSNGDYFLKTEENTFTSNGITGTQTGFEVLLLKDYLPVGGTWTGSYTQTTTYNNPLLPSTTGTTNYTGTILEIGSSITVGSASYDSVIKIKIHQSTAISGLASTVDTDYWFAKNVGLVKSITYAADGTTPQYTTLLTSYILN